MTTYDDDRRMFHAMRLAGWSHDQKTGGFVKRLPAGGTLWVSWGQAESALALADEGEAVAAVAPQSRTVAALLNSAANEQ